MDNSTRLRRVACVCLLLLVGASCTESDSKLFEDIGLTRLYPSDPDLAPQSVIVPGNAAQAARWTVASAILDVEGVELSTELAPGGDCEIVATVVDFPRFLGECASGFVLDAAEEPVDVQLEFTITSMELVRAMPVDLADTVDFDGDGVPNDGDGSGFAFDNPCGLTDDATGCDDNCPLVYNPDQTDNDANGIGQACTTVSPVSGTTLRDSDGDGVSDGVDNCVWLANPGQEDTTGRFLGGDVAVDGIGDACTEQLGTVELEGVTSFTLDLGPTELLQPIGFSTFITIDLDSDRTLDCDWETGTCVLDAAEVRFCSTLTELQALNGCP